MYISRNLEQWNAFPTTLQTAFEQGESTRFLNASATPDERDAVGLRLQIVAQLLDKTSLSRNSANLNTSAATITRGSHSSKQWIRIFINWVKSQLDEQAAKTKQILTALLHFFAHLGGKNWQQVAWRFSLTILAFSFVFALSLFLLCLYGTAKIGHLLQLDLAIQSNMIG